MKCSFMTFVSSPLEDLSDCTNFMPNLISWDCPLKIKCTYSVIVAVAQGRVKWSLPMPPGFCTWSPRRKNTYERNYEKLDKSTYSRELFKGIANKVLAFQQGFLVSSLAGAFLKQIYVFVLMKLELPLQFREFSGLSFGVNVDPAVAY